MSTHDIWFFWEIWKIIPQLSFLCILIYSYELSSTAVVIGTLKVNILWTLKLQNPERGKQQHCTVITYFFFLINTLIIKIFEIFKTTKTYDKKWWDCTPLIKILLIYDEGEAIQMVDIPPFFVTSNLAEKRCLLLSE